MADYVKVASVDQLQPEQGMLVEPNGQRIAVFRTGGEYFAIDDTCTHIGAPLHEGQLMGQCVVCPWHGAMFQLSTGQGTPPAHGPVKRYPVRLNGSDIEVAIDFQA
jgi:nitrite reductase/ring-hydroxylating ferredoxin subunit